MVESHPIPVKLKARTAAFPAYGEKKSPPDTVVGRAFENCGAGA